MSCVLVAIMTFSVFAADESGKNTALCFDNNKSLSVLQKEGGDVLKATGFSVAISNEYAAEGAGSLAVIENLVSESKNTGGGFFLTAKDLGLDSFAGCTISAKVYPVGVSIDMDAKIVMYTDSQIYKASGTGGITAGKWNDISLTVPAECYNTKLGFSIPIYTPWTGPVYYLDELTVLKPDGTYVQNIGDFEEVVIEEEAPVNKAANTLMTILLVILILVIIGAVVLFIHKMIHRYR
jgi:hypothetical protein